MSRSAWTVVCSLLSVATALALFAVAVEVPAAAPIAVAALVGLLLVSVVLGRWLTHCAEAECAALRSELARVAGRLEHSEVVLQRFVDSLAHEIKTPLTILSNEAQLLCLRRNDQVAVLAHGKTIAGYLMHFSGLVDGFMRLAGPTRSADASHHVPVAVHEFVVAAVHRAESMAAGRGVHVVVTLAEPGAAYGALEVCGDHVLLEAMFESLLRYAIQSAPRESRVAVQVKAAGETIRLLVSDQGPAMAPSDMESGFVWDSAYSPTTTRGGGQSVSLAIAIRIARHHAGTIDLRNLPDGGCEFAVTLPRAQAGSPPPSPVIGPSPYSNPV